MHERWVKPERLFRDIAATKVVCLDGKSGMNDCFGLTRFHVFSLHCQTGPIPIDNSYGQHVITLNSWISNRCYRLQLIWQMLVSCNSLRSRLCLVCSIKRTFAFYLYLVTRQVVFHNNYNFKSLKRYSQFRMGETKM